MDDLLAFWQLNMKVPVLRHAERFFCGLCKKNLAKKKKWFLDCQAGELKGNKVTGSGADFLTLVNY